MVRRIRWSTLAAVGLALALTGSALAAVSYTWGSKDPVGGADQWGAWMNGTHATAYTIDKTVDPKVTYTHFVYVSDAALDGTWTTDTKCTGRNLCLANYYIRSTNGGRTWNNPVKIPAPANTPTDRGTLAAAGKTVLVAYVDQDEYYQGGATFNVNDPRAAWYSRNTNHGTGAWTAQKKLPGQSATSRVDYLNAWASGSSVHIVTTDVDTGDIWYWRSTDKGKTFSQPATIGSTTFVDDKTIAEGGYVGGFSGLPMIAASGTDVIASWIDNPSGRVVTAVSTNGGTSWGSETQLVASGGADNSGYVQMDARGNRIAVTWTTADGGWLKIWDTGTDTWGASRQFVSFPDTDPGVGTTNNKGGEGAIVALGPAQIVSVAVSECNDLTDGTGCELSLTDNDAREQLVFRSSDDNGATWSDPSIVGPVATPEASWVNNYGDAIYIKSKPLVIWNGHDAVYGTYQNFRRIGTPQA